MSGDAGAKIQSMVKRNLCNTHSVTVAEIWVGGFSSAFILEMDRKSVINLIFLAFMVKRVHYDAEKEEKRGSFSSIPLIPLQLSTYDTINVWFVSCVCADPGSGLFIDNVLPSSESWDFLRLAIDPSALQCTPRDIYILTHPPPLSPSPPPLTDSSIHCLSSLWHSLWDVTSSHFFC